jgi:hypothetical protein
VKGHISIYRLADILAIGQLKQIRKAGLGRQVHHAFGLVVFFADLAATRTLPLQLLLSLCESMVGVAEENQPQDWDRVFGRLEFGVGPKLIGGFPESSFGFRVIIGHLAVRFLVFVGSKPQPRFWAPLKQGEFNSQIKAVVYASTFLARAVKKPAVVSGVVTDRPPSRRLIAHNATRQDFLFRFDGSSKSPRSANGGTVLL